MLLWYIVLLWSIVSLHSALCCYALLANSTQAFSAYCTQIVSLEQPELEERHYDLVASIATDQKQLLAIEDEILGLLNDAGSGVDILDDEVITHPAYRRLVRVLLDFTAGSSRYPVSVMTFSVGVHITDSDKCRLPMLPPFYNYFGILQTLITTLSRSKGMSKAISERLADSKSTQRQIEENRESYRPVAVRGSLLYFTVAELCRVDSMYQYSLDYFEVGMYHVSVSQDQSHPRLPSFHFKTRHDYILTCILTWIIYHKCILARTKCE